MNGTKRAIFVLGVFIVALASLRVIHVVGQTTTETTSTATANSLTCTPSTQPAHGESTCIATVLDPTVGIIDFYNGSSNGGFVTFSPANSCTVQANSASATCSVMVSCSNTPDMVNIVAVNGATILGQTILTCTAAPTSTPEFPQAALAIVLLATLGAVAMLHKRPLVRDASGSRRVSLGPMTVRYDAAVQM